MTAPAVVELALDLIASHPKNPRRDLGDLTELTASIKADGVRSPIHVIPDAKFGDQAVDYLVVAGHRRREASLLAGRTTIPAIIREDLKSDADALVEMAVENLLRADLTPVEEAVLFEQLQIAGLKPTAIAKKTGRKKQTVEARLALMTLPEAARDAVHGAQLSLDDAAALVEFADDPAEVERLTKAAGTSNFRWDLQSARNRRESAAKREASIANLAAAGVTVIDQPGRWWQHSLMYVLGSAVPGLTDDADPDEVRRAWHAEHCEHHVAWVDQQGDVTYGCSTPAAHDQADEEHDDTPRSAAASTSAGRDPVVDHAALMAQQAKDREDCETAWAIRKEFIRDHATGKRAISALAADELGRLWVAHAVEFYVEVDPPTTADYLGLDLTEEQRDDMEESSKAVQAVVEKRTGAQAMLAALAAVEEDNLSRAGQWGAFPSNAIAPGSTERAWLDFLVDELGYELTQWEAERVVAADQAALDRTAAQEAEEDAGDDDDREQDDVDEDETGD